MKSVYAILFAATVGFGGAALAADPQAVVSGSDPQTVHTRLVAAAEKVCAQARANDPFGDYGSQGECVEDTLDHARMRHVAYQAQYTAQYTQRQTNAAPIR
jgi:hypothetical protein